MKPLLLIALAVVLAGCAAETGPPGQASPATVNPETGSRGGGGK